MKHIDASTFIAGLAISFIVGILTFLAFGNLIFAGLCIIAAAILYAVSLCK